MKENNCCKRYNFFSHSKPKEAGHAAMYEKGYKFVSAILEFVESYKDEIKVM